MQGDYRFALSQIREDEVCVIFGAGEYGREILISLKQEGRKILLFCDNFRSNTVCEGYKVMSFADIQKGKETYSYIVAVKDIAAKMEILEQLFSAGIGKGRIVIPAQGMESTRNFFAKNGLFLLALYDVSEKESFSREFLSGETIRIRSVFHKAAEAEEVFADAILIADQKHFDELEEDLLAYTTKPIIGLWEAFR